MYIASKARKEWNFFMKKIITNNENETIDFAYNFAKNLKKGDIIILSGELGSRQNKICTRSFKVF